MCICALTIFPMHGSLTIQILLPTAQVSAVEGCPVSGVPLHHLSTHVDESISIHTTAKAKLLFNLLIDV